MPPRNSTALWSRLCSGILLAASALLLALHYVHLKADFPHYSPWPDPARVTDEGWYAGAAVRQILSGQWFLPGDFNPAVALPVFPALVYATFRLTGVSVVALRALNVSCFGATLIVLWLLVRRYANPLAAAAAVFLCACCPFYYAYSRLGIVEPLLAFESLLVLLAASYLTLDSSRLRLFLTSAIVGVLLALMVFTKTTGLCLYPAAFYLMLSRCGFNLRRFLAPAALAAVVAVALAVAYYAAVVHAGLTRDYYDLFAINHAHIHGRIVPVVLWNVAKKGALIGPVFYAVAAVSLLLAALFLRKDPAPLLVASVLGIAGYGAFITYHGWLMERYYLVPVALIAMALVLSLTRLANSGVLALRLAASALSAVLLIDCIVQIHTLSIWTRNPNYGYAQAADALYRVIDRDPSANRVVISVVGEQLAMFTGERGIFINDVYGTQPLRLRVLEYKPGWLIGFDGVSDQAVNALSGLYTRQLVDSEPAFGDDGFHFRMYLYKLSPIPTQVPAAQGSARPPHVSPQP